MRQRFSDHSWLIASGVLITAGFSALAVFSHQFGYDVEVADMAIRPLVLLLSAIGAVYCIAAAALLRQVGAPGTTVAPASETPSLDENTSTRHLLLFVVAIGVLARAVLFFSEPILEDDYQRYLWDGGVVAHGLDPYAVAPAAASGDAERAGLATAAGVTLERVNHAEIRTIYPLGAQGFFALAHLIAPFDLLGWRVVVLAGDAATFGLVLLLLARLGLPPVLGALYWWNPLVIKELANSLHMEAVLMPFVVAIVLASIARRPRTAALLIGIAGAIKIWPLVLFPLAMRSARVTWARLIVSALIVVVITIAWLAPIVLAGLDEKAGVVAYADAWRTMGAMFSILHAAATGALALAGSETIAGLDANRIARAAIIVFAGLAALWLAARPITDAPDDMRASARRFALLIFLLFLVSPAQFPWYVVWCAPFFAILPLAGMIALAVVMPIYYWAFELMVVDRFALFTDVVIWLAWAPIWLLLVGQAILAPLAARGRTAAHLTPGGEAPRIQTRNVHAQ
ncbi:MAG: hypothetical protein AAFQ42_05400 [Pseudomonadota bacterium]